MIALSFVGLAAIVIGAAMVGAMAGVLVTGLCAAATLGERLEYRDND